MLSLKTQKLTIEQMREMGKAFKAQADQIMALLKAHMGWDDDKARQWYMAKNPNFGGVSAHEMVALGRGHKVIQFIQGAIEESKPCTHEHIHKIQVGMGYGLKCSDCGLTTGALRELL